MKKIPGIKFIDDENKIYFHASWLSTVLAENRDGLMRKLDENNIESDQVHYRNDRYSIFSKFDKNNLPNMDSVEDKYFVLPMHAKVSINDVNRIVDTIRSGW